MQIQNPFETIIDRLSNIEHCLLDLKLAGMTSSTLPLDSQQDRVNFRGALKFLNEQGFKISESQLYKKTSAKEVPFKNFGRQLIFSRKDLLNWLETQTIDPGDTSGLELTLARSARRKTKRA